MDCIEIKIGKYTLLVYKNREWFLINQDGEGMSITIEDIERLLDQHFKENF